MEINTSLPYMQNLNSALNFNPIQSYNNTLKGSASFDVNKGVADNFDNILQQSMKAEEVAYARKFYAKADGCYFCCKEAHTS